MVPTLRKSRSSVRTVGILAIAALTMAALRGQAQPAGGQEVTLSPGTCPAIQNGDIAVLEWNPAFQTTLSLTDIENFRLRFTAPLEQRTTRSGSVLELRLRPQRSTTPVGTPIEDMHNGYFRMRFRVNVPALASGEYHLESAEAEAKLAADGSSVPAVMMNDPSRSAFCVTLTGAAAGTTNGKKGRSN